MSSMVSRIEELEERVLELGRLVERAISRAIAALKRRDTLLAQAVIRDDAEIDRMEIEVQELCVVMLEQGGSSTAEIRTIVAMLKVNDNLERIADLAENVAQVIVKVGDWERFQQVDGTTEIATKAQRMVTQSLLALRGHDTFLARQVIRADEAVDDLQRIIRQRIEHEVDRIPEYANPLMRLEHITRQFERMADLATNIAEEVIYLVDGQIVRHVG